MRLKKEMSAADVRILVGELQGLVGCRVDKIYQPDKGTLLFRFRGGERQDVVFDTKGFIFLSSNERNMPAEPTPFAMLLRKHLSGGRVQSVEQHRFDRIVFFNISTGGGEFTLCFELFGGGNIILVKDDIIVMPLRHKSWKYRTVRPREEYVLPPDTNDPTDMDEEQFGEILSISTKDMVRCLAVDVNLGGELAEEACLSSGVEMSIAAEEVEEAALNKLFSSAKIILEKIYNPKPYVVVENNSPVAFSFLSLVRYSHMEKVEFSNLSASIEHFYDNLPEEKSASPIEGKLLRQMEQQKKAVKEFEEEERLNRSAAEAMYSNYVDIQRILEVLGEMKNQGLSLNDVVDAIKKKYEVISVDPAKNIIKIIVPFEDEKYVVSLDWKIGVEENASRHYSDAKKSKEKMQGALEAIQDTERAMETLEEKQAAEEDKPRKRFWFERYKWFVTSEGNLVIAGRDAESNDRIVKKHMKDSDRYAHADMHGAPSVVVKDSGVPIGEDTLEEACIFAVIQSKAWSAKIGSADAYWVMPDQVSKTPNPGEFLARGAFVIRGKRNYQRRMPLRAMVRNIIWEGERMVMCSPVVENPSQPYAILEPGDEKKSLVARKLANTFGVGVDEVMRILPPGNVRVVELKEG